MDTQRLSGLGLEPVLTTSELAEYLGVNAQTIYDLRADGRGPSGFRVGREIRFGVSDVAAAAATAYVTVIPDEREDAHAARLAPFFAAGSPLLTEQPNIANPQGHDSVVATVTMLKKPLAAPSPKKSAGCWCST
ncbi:helix-turn-helix domain-containing protein [Marisediminicola antarctica]|uniref:Helix-turn-helix domain-containing protein n=1 Tax=Marisediminicola antarctica TaxID=674079 RepID=A0A7L5AHQ9_9MICO|nr:helix-turn-helix domain-containing protein [Marisediminicola antarctica]QHO69847.1 hypothetical protein BHD05_09535 [Marisediminicola antarctica]